MITNQAEPTSPTLDLGNHSDDLIQLVCGYWHEQLVEGKREPFEKVRDQIKHVAASPAFLATLAEQIRRENTAKAKEQARLAARHRFEEGDAVVYARFTRSHNKLLQTMRGRIARVNYCIPNDALAANEAAPAYQIDFGWEALFWTGQRTWMLADKWLDEGDPDDVPPRVFTKNEIWTQEEWEAHDPWGPVPRLSAEKIAELKERFDLKEKPRLKWVQNDIPPDYTGRIKIKAIWNSDRALCLRNMEWPILVQIRQEDV